ncbi:MAG: ABC transporter substrate-binding protein [Paraperlucidibaca sp.]
MSNFLKVLLPVFALTLPAFVQAAPEANPQAVVQTAITKLTARIDKDRVALRKSPDALNAVIEENITPFVDIPGIARGVMGQYFRQASDAQRDRFATIFKQSMVRTYANGLTSYDNQTVTVKPYTPGEDANRAQVEVEVALDNGTVVPVIFQMIRAGDGRWMTRNLIVNGLNLGLTFRKRFAEVVEQNAGNIDKAISSWSPASIDAVKSKS